MKRTEPYTGPFPRGRHSHKCLKCVERGQDRAVACYKKQLLWILALAIALWCIPARAQDRGTITLALTLQNNRYFAIVAVNGEKCNLMIDTGADATIINPKALGPNLAYGQNVTIRGVDGGTVKARQADVTISWSKTEAASYKIVAGQLTKLGDGILGMDVLGKFDSITLDTKNKTLTLR